MASRQIEIRGIAGIASSTLASQGFDARAIHMLADSYQRAFQRGFAGKIPAIFVLWAILRWDNCPEFNRMKSNNIDLHALEDDVESEINVLFNGLAEADFEVDWIDIEPIVSIAITARTVAVTLGYEVVTASDLLLAIFRSADPEIARVVAKHNLTQESLSCSGGLESG